MTLKCITYEHTYKFLIRLQNRIYKIKKFSFCTSLICPQETQDSKHTSPNAVSRSKLLQNPSHNHRMRINSLLASEDWDWEKRAHCNHLTMGYRSTHHCRHSKWLHPKMSLKCKEQGWKAAQQSRGFAALGEGQSLGPRTYLRGGDAHNLL